MKIITLEEVTLTSLTRCFNLAFSDYVIKFNATEDYLKNRWKNAGVDYSLSVGVLDGEKLVGFIVNCVRPWNGKLTAFNCGTGVIPSHRGNQLTEKMYDFFIPKLKEQNVESLALEVIQENAKAIHLYQKVGLEIRRGLDIYTGEIKVDKVFENVDGLEFRKIESLDLVSFASMLEYEPVWENNNLTIQSDISNHEFFGVFLGKQTVAFAVVHMENENVPQFGFHLAYRNEEVGKFLFYHISRAYPEVKIKNVDASANRIIDLIKIIGLEKRISQYEMVSYL